MRKPVWADLKRLFRQKGKLVLCLSLILAICVWGGLAVFVPDQYASAAVMFASGDCTARDYQLLFEINGLMDEIGDRLGVEKLARKASVSIDVPDGSHVLSITAFSSSPELSAMVAECTVRLLEQSASEAAPSSSFSLLKAASVPEKPCGPHRLRCVLIVFACALLVGACFFAVRDLFDYTLHEETPVGLLDGRQPFARIGDFRREIVLRRKNSTPFCRSLGHEVLKQAQAMLSDMQTGTVWGFTDTCSADGKAELCVLLAETAARDGKRVLLVDAGSDEPSPGRLLRRRGRYDLEDVLHERVALQNAVMPAAQDKLFLLDRVHALSCKAIAQNKAFDPLLKILRRQFDLILFCLPGAEDAEELIPMGRKMDSVVLAAGIGEADLRRIPVLWSDMEKAQIHVFGTVFTHCARKN